MDRNRFTEGIKNIFRVIIWPIGVYLLFFLLSKLLKAGEFGSFNSIKMIFLQAVPNAIVAWGIIGNMMSGRWDFSIGGMIVLSCLAGAPIAKFIGIGPVGTILSCAAVGALLGILNGIAYLRIKIPMLLISIGMMKIYECAGYLINGGKSARLSGNMTLFGRAPYIYFICIIMFLFFHYMYTHTIFGKQYYALRDGQGITVSLGVDESMNAFICFIICGICSGVAGSLYLSITGTMQSSPMYNNSMGMMFNAFAPAFIGRYLSKYTNISIGVFVGSLTMKMLTSGVIAIGMPSAMQNVGNGIFLIIFMAFSVNQERMIEWNERRKMAAQISKGHLKTYSG
jgi:ribose transport system permease protein